MRQKRYSLLARQSRLLKLLGIYMAVVLLIFAIFIPFLGPKDKEQQLVPEPVMTQERQDAAVMGTVLPDTERQVTSAVPATLPVITSDPGLRTPDSELGSHPSTAVADLKKIIWPIKGEVSQQFGMGYSRTYSDYRFHNGIDIKVKMGSDIVAIMPGKVIKVETTKNDGIVIVLEHGTGWQSMYTHLEDSFIKVGATVKSGQVLGSVGQPGLSEVLDGSHLHLTLTKDGQAVNPLDYLPE